MTNEWNELEEEFLWLWLIEVMKVGFDIFCLTGFARRTRRPNVEASWCPEAFMHARPPCPIETTLKGEYCIWRPSLGSRDPRSGHQLQFDTSEEWIGVLRYPSLRKETTSAIRGLIVVSRFVARAPEWCRNIGPEDVSYGINRMGNGFSHI